MEDTSDQQKENKDYHDFYNYKQFTTQDAESQNDKKQDYGPHFSTQLHNYIASRFEHLFENPENEKDDDGFELYTGKKQLVDFTFWTGFNYDNKSDKKKLLLFMIETFNELNQQIFPIFQSDNVSNFFKKKIYRS